jgi:uncharacterized membrane protein
MTVEEGLKMVISGGIVTPGTDREAGDTDERKSAEAKVETTREIA